MGGKTPESILEGPGVCVIRPSSDAKEGACWGRRARFGRGEGGLRLGLGHLLQQTARPVWRAYPIARPPRRDPCIPYVFPSKLQWSAPLFRVHREADVSGWASTPFAQLSPFMNFDWVGQLPYSVRRANLESMQSQRLTNI